MKADLKTIDDESLARAARRGDLSAFEILVKRYQVRLMRFLAKRFPNLRDAEDIFQETMLKAFRSLNRYDARRPFKAWLFTLLYNTAISTHRSLKPAIRLEGVTEPASLPFDTVAAAEESENLWNIARSVLTDEQFVAMWLFYVEELGAPEIANVLGRSWGSVKTMIHRARKTLGRALSPKLEDAYAS